MVEDKKAIDKDNNKSECEENDSVKEACHEKVEEDGAEQDPAVELNKKLEAEKKEKEELNERFLRLCAEFDNSKKRALREISDFRKFANESIIKEMLSVLDNLERALASAKEDSNSNQGVVDGVEMTISEMLKIFDKYGVVAVKTVDEVFNPEFHQAVMQEETDLCAENTVVKELQKGYLMHERLIRPAMVVVAKALSLDKKEDANKKA